MLLLFSSLLLPSLELSDTKVYEPEIRELLKGDALRESTRAMLCVETAVGSRVIRREMFTSATSSSSSVLLSSLELSDTKVYTSLKYECNPTLCRACRQQLLRWFLGSGGFHLKPLPPPVD